MVLHDLKIENQKRLFNKNALNFEAVLDTASKVTSYPF